MNSKAIIILTITAILAASNAMASSMRGWVSCQPYTFDSETSEPIDLEGELLNADLSEAQGGKVPSLMAFYKVPNSKRIIDVYLSFIYADQIGGPIEGISVSAEDDRGRELGEFEFPILSGYYAMTVPSNIKMLKKLNIQCNVNLD